MKDSEVWTDRALGIGVCIVTFIAAHAAYEIGMPQKWDAAIFGTLVPFAVVVSIKRTSWRRATFWASLGAFLAVHLLLIGVFFEYVLWDARTFGWLWWLPIAFLEAVALLGLQPALEKKLRSQRSH